MFIQDKKLTDDEIIENVRLELIAKLEFILKDLKGEVTDEPKNYFDHTFIFMNLLIGESLSLKKKLLKMFKLSLSTRNILKNSFTRRVYFVYVVINLLF